MGTVFAGYYKGKIDQNVSHLFANSVISFSNVFHDIARNAIREKSGSSCKYFQPSVTLALHLFQSSTPNSLLRPFYPVVKS